MIYMPLQKILLPVLYHIHSLRKHGPSHLMLRRTRFPLTSISSLESFFLYLKPPW